MTIYKQNTRGLLMPSRGLRRGADNIRPNTPSTGSYTVDPSGPAFEPGVIHAWNPDGGADASGMIADVVGAAPMWIMNSGAPVVNWTGEMVGGALVVEPPGLADFKALTGATLTFWALMRSTSHTYAAYAGMGDAQPVTGGTQGSWLLRREGSTLMQYSVRTSSGGAASANGSAPVNDEWYHFSLRFGASQWRSIANNYAASVGLTWVSTPKQTTNDWPLILGAYPLAVPKESVGDGSYNGRFGDVRLWDHVLDNAEVAALYAAGRQTY